MELSTLRAFEDEIRKLVPKFEIVYKDRSRWMRLLGFLSRPFNPGFSTKFTTTFYPKVYFPSQEYYESTPKQSLTVLAHELVHLLDSQKRPLWFRVSYALPQALAILPLLAFVSLAGWQAWPLLLLVGGVVVSLFSARISLILFWLLTTFSLILSSVLIVTLTGWTSVVFFLGLLLLAPWPSPWRSDAERRAYIMNLAIVTWTYGEAPPPVVLDTTLRYFTGPDYYFMSWRKKAIQDGFNEGIQAAKEGALLRDPAFGLVYEFLISRGELRK